MSESVACKSLVSQKYARCKAAHLTQIYVIYIAAAQVAKYRFDLQGHCGYILEYVATCAPDWCVGRQSRGDSVWRPAVLHIYQR